MGEVTWPALIAAAVMAAAKTLDWLYEQYQARREKAKKGRADLSADERETLKTALARADTREDRYDQLWEKYEARGDRLIACEDELDTTKRRLVRFVNAFQYLAWDNVYLSRQAGVEPPSAYKYQYLIDESSALNGGDNPNA